MWWPFGKGGGSGNANANNSGSANNSNNNNNNNRNRNAGSGGARRGGSAASGKVPPPASFSQLAEPQGGVKVTSGFDPTALERGVEAMKALDNSPNAQAALQIALEQEKSKRSELEAYRTQTMAQHQQQMAQAQREHQELAMKQTKMKEEEARRTAHYRAQLEQQNNKEKLEAQRKLEAQKLAQQREEFERQMQIRRATEREIEEQKRETMRQQAKLDQDTARIAAQARTEGEIRRERENEDIMLRKVKLSAEEERSTRKAVVDLAFNRIMDIGAAVNTVLSDPWRTATYVGGLSALFLGIYSARTATSVAGRLLEARLGTPRLVRETSRLNWRSAWRRAFSLFQRKPEIMKGMVFPPMTAKRLEWLSTSTMNTKKHRAPFRNVMLYGPPGTGKTLFAKSLSESSGLDYAIVTGGDFGPLGSKAVTELHKLFDWAEASQRGTVIFIDEAEAFLRKGRATGEMSEAMRNVMSAFLNRTGTESTQFMVVLATNAPQVLDKAVLDRIDQSFDIPLPGLEEREQLLRMYFNKYIENPDLPWNVPKIEFEGFDDMDSVFKAAARETEGFSGRQLMKLMVSLQSSVYGGMTAKLTPEMLHTMVTWRKKELAVRKQGDSFLGEQHDVTPPISS